MSYSYVFYKWDSNFLDKRMVNIEETYLLRFEQLNQEQIMDL